MFGFRINRKQQKETQLRPGASRSKIEVDGVPRKLMQCGRSYVEVMR